MKKILLLLGIAVSLMALECEDRCKDYDEISDSYNRCVDVLDSLTYKHNEQKLICIRLAEINDSIIRNQPKDTVWQTVTDTLWAWRYPQCTLCYDYLDSVNGEQYYVGYDGVYYKIYQSGDTLLKYIYKDTVVDLYLTPRQRTNIRITGKGTPCLGEYPKLKIYVNDEIVEIFEINSEEYKTYEYNARFHLSEVDSVRVVFDNDCYEPDLGEDRNAWVSEVYINFRNRLKRNDAKIKGFIGWVDDSDTVSLPSHGTITVFNDRK